MTLIEPNPACAGANTGAGVALPPLLLGPESPTRPPLGASTLVLWEPSTTAGLAGWLLEEVALPIEATAGLGDVMARLGMAYLILLPDSGSIRAGLTISLFTS